MTTIMDNEENDVLCEKIINEIHGVFLKDTDLASFEIIPTLLNQNKSPVIHVDHNLGLESWCAKHVYEYSHKTIIDLKLSNNIKNLLYNDTIIKYLNVALLINPDVTTFWHIRRQLIEKNRLNVQKEFQFSGIVLTKKPKSIEAFAYRRWLFSFQSPESIDWSFEIGICERCADKSSSNYHAWTHRQWVLQKAPYFLKTEILLTEKFIKKHISDYSCYHYRQFVLRKLYENEYYDKDDSQIKDDLISSSSVSSSSSSSSLIYLKEFLNFYLIDHVNTLNEIIDTLLPSINKIIKKDFNNVTQDSVNKTATTETSSIIKNPIIISENKLKSFLFCCNLAAYDIKFCDELKNLFGNRESFENHRRASLKFIVDNCLKLNNLCTNNELQLLNSEKMNVVNVDNDGDDDDDGHREQPPKQSKLSNYDYKSNPFLLSLKKSEGMLGEKHRKWCKIFLGFDYSENSI